ncbi:MAG: phage holin family protein [Gemmatimonadales bacterium]
MSGFIARLFITAFGLWMADAVLSGVWFDGVVALWIAALLLGLVNAFVRPLIVVLTLPITLMTLGLFLFVINGAMLLVVAWLMPSFHVDGLGWAILASVIVGITGWLANAFVGEKGKVQVWTVTRRGGR